MKRYKVVPIRPRVFHVVDRHDGSIIAGYVFRVSAKAHANGLNRDEEERLRRAEWHRERFERAKGAA